MALNLQQILTIMFRLIGSRVILILFLLSTFLQAKDWELGYGAGNFDSFPAGLTLGGYDRRAGKADKPSGNALQARAIAIRRGGETVVIVSADLIAFMPQDAERIRNNIASRFNLKPENIFLTATHTHSGPDIIGLWGGIDEKHFPLIDSTVRSSVSDALAMSPGSLTVGKGDSASLFDRRNKVPTQAEHRLFYFDPVGRSSAQSPTALWIFPVHPTVLDRHSKVYSADFIDPLRESLSQGSAGGTRFLAKGGARLVYLNGAQGNLEPSVARSPTDHSAKYEPPPGAEHDPALMNKYRTDMTERMAKYADSLGGVFGNALSNTTPTSNEMMVRHATVEVPIENPVFVKAAKAGMLRLSLAENKSVRVPISVLNLGGEQLLFVPAEFTQMAQKDVQREYPGTIIVGLANGQVGYGVSQTERRDNGYEESLSPTPRLVPLCLEALASVAMR